MGKNDYLKYWPVAFKDKEWENEFILNSFSEKRIIATIYIAFNVILFLLYLKNDFLLFGSSSQYEILLIIRLSFALNSLLSIFLFYKINDFKLFQILTTIWLVTTMIIITYIDSTRPGNYLTSSFTDILFIFSVYVLFPLNINFKLPLGIGFSIICILIFIFLRKDMTTLHINSQFIVFFGANLIGIVICIRNEIFNRIQFKLVLDEKKHKEEIEKYAHKLEVINNDLDAYNRTVAHDLKNPLSGTIGVLDILREEYQDLLNINEELKEYINMVSGSSLRMVNIINELLLLASVNKIDRIVLSPLNMNSIILNVQERLKHQIKETETKIIVPDSWEESLGYDPWVEEVWANYISNAIKYGGTPPVIELGCKKFNDKMVKFWIKDNGEGVDISKCKELFKEFTNITPKKENSHGLGLSIVFKIVDKLGGECGCDENNDGGAIFYFTLPRV